MKKLLFCFIIFFCHIEINGQNKTNPTFSAQRGKFVVYNIGLGSVLSVAGALINKKEEDKPKVLLKRALQGACGGLLRHQAKSMVYQIAKTENPIWAWPARILDAGGSSLIESAASNEEWFSRLHFNIGFFRLQWNKISNYKTQVRFLPNSFYGHLFIKSKGKWDPELTFKTGVMIYSTASPIIHNQRAFAGLANTNVFSLSFFYLYPYTTLSHELIHVFQYEDFIAVNQFAKRQREDLIEKSSLIRWLSTWMYYDFNSSVFSGFYRLEKVWPTGCYQNNFFELEADHYSAKRAFGVCY